MDDFITRKQFNFSELAIFQNFSVAFSFPKEKSRGTKPQVQIRPPIISIIKIKEKNILFIFDNFIISLTELSILWDETFENQLGYYGDIKGLISNQHRSFWGTQDIPYSEPIARWTRFR